MSGASDAGISIRNADAQEPNGGAKTPTLTERFASVADFIQIPTPPAWVEWAVQNQSMLLWDHGNCEKKAASSALSLMFRYPEHNSLVHRMSRLAREELRHFEQVQKLIEQRAYAYEMVPAARYAGGLRSCVRSQEPQRLIDMLIVGAYIEARSCERFAALVPHLDDVLAKFYRGLMESEARHFQDYLALAAEYAPPEELITRIEEIGREEARLIGAPAESFAFHSGPPA
ncbi:MAG: tRNA-(ms[2]io[6]A)-hydroxylase [Gammaproteobacteria bacterium]|nr:tRNA-(ms[2]io[6]A)-hydroxylase [Gammaproteobacteria bacterium]